MHRSLSLESKHYWNRPVVYPICQFALVSVQNVYCGKMAKRIQMPFGVVSGVGQWMGILDRVVIVKGEGAVLGVNVGHPTETNRDFCCIVVRE